MRSLINNLLDTSLRDILITSLHLTEDEMCTIVDKFLDIAETISANNEKEKCFCRTEAYQYLRISRSSFDAKVKEGVLPKGYKTPGRGPVWFKKDLDAYITSKGKRK